MEVNHKDLLYFENKNIADSKKPNKTEESLSAMLKKLPDYKRDMVFNSKVTREGLHMDFRESAGLSFKMNS